MSPRAGGRGSGRNTGGLPATFDPVGDRKRARAAAAASVYSGSPPIEQVADDEPAPTALSAADADQPDAIVDQGGEGGADVSVETEEAPAEANGSFKQGRKASTNKATGSRGRASTKTDKPSSQGAAAVPPVADLPMPAVKRKRVQRISVNTRIRTSVEELMQQFAEDHGAAIQDIVDMSVEEWLAARGYKLPEGEQTKLR